MTQQAQGLLALGEQLSIPGRVSFVTNCARSGRDWTVNVLLAVKLFFQVALETQPTRGILNQQVAMVAAVGVVTRGTLSLGHGLVDEGAIRLNVAERAKPGLGGGQREEVPGRIGGRVARVALLLCRRGVQHLARKHAAVAFGREASWD